MSHRESALMPWIASYTDSFSAAGASTLTLTGFGLSLSTDVDLGTLGTETGRAYTATDGDGNGNLVISLNVAALPESPATVQVAVSNGGVPAVQSPLSVLHGFTPEALVKSASDGWFNASGIGGSSTPANGADVSEWTVNGTTSGLSKLWQGAGSNQPHYVAAHTGWASGATGNHPGITGPGVQSLRGGQDGTWDKSSAENYTMAMVISPTSQTNWLRAMMRWGNNSGLSDTHYQDFLSVLSDVSWDSSLDDKINVRVRGQNFANNHIYDPGTLPDTMRLVLRRDGSSSDLFYNSATAVSSPTVGSSTSNADRGIVYACDAVVAEVLYLKYAASDAEVASLMSYWGNKYGS